MNQYTIKDAIRIVTSTAKDYRESLEGQNYLFIFRNRSDNSIGYFESVFLPRNFQHLTGLDMIDENGNIDNKPLLFYERCLSGKLSDKTIKFRSDGTSFMKLEALPKVVNFISSSKMTGIYTGNRPLLAIDRLAGTTNFCLGFTMSGRFYTPSSCLLEDIRKLTDIPAQVLAIVSKSSDEKIYGNIRYVAKGLSFSEIILPDDLDHIIDRSGYIRS